MKESTKIAGSAVAGFGPITATLIFLEMFPWLVPGWLIFTIFLVMLVPIALWFNKAFDNFPMAILMGVILSGLNVVVMSASNDNSQRVDFETGYVGVPKVVLWNPAVIKNECTKEENHE